MRRRNHGLSYASRIRSGAFIHIVRLRLEFASLHASRLSRLVIDASADPSSTEGRVQASVEFRMLGRGQQRQ